MILGYSSIHKRNLIAYLTGIRHIVDEGGTSSSKTYSILQLLIDIAIYTKEQLIISVVSESMPHLKLGAIRDFKKIMGNRYIDKRMNHTDNIYNFDRAQMEFFSADNESKVHGPRRDILFLNEVINIPKPVCDHLVVRTNKTIFYDFNPCSEFWLHDMRGGKNVEWIHSTYLDAKRYLPAAIVEEIESRKDKDPNWWNVYGLGLIGNIEGLVYPLFTVVDEMPVTQKGFIFGYGLDFGYANSMTALIANIVIGDHITSDEIIYEKGLKNDQLVKLMEERGVSKEIMIVADCEDPKSIDEIRDYGYNIVKCEKKPGSVEHGIQKVNQYYQHWTKRSINSIKEQRNHRYLTDKLGTITNTPSKIWNHSLDARRYFVDTEQYADIRLCAC